MLNWHLLQTVTFWCFLSLQCLLLGSYPVETKPLYPNDQVRRRLPGALIIGAKKSGTRALLEFLRLHPDVQAPGPEMHFFDRKYHLGLEWYRNQMPATHEGQITMEKTPGYFVHPHAPARVRAMNPRMKLVLVVREPVSRALSDFAQALQRKGPQAAGTFARHAILANSAVNTSWSAIRIGLYAHHLDNWLVYFPSDQIHIVSGEELVDSPGSVMTSLQRFLNLTLFITENNFYFNRTKGFPCVRQHWRTARPHCFGSNKGRRHPAVEPQVLANLYDFYRPHNEVFYNMTARNFGWPTGLDSTRTLR